jgi:type 2A phosphatase activator TIP41
MSLLSIKVRVMPHRLLLLSRFFLRLDDVIFRVRDTRVYVDFDTGEVIRDYSVMEEKYATLKEVLIMSRC